jgi:hypothetical protein
MSMAFRARRLAQQLLSGVTSDSNALVSHENGRARFVVRRAFSCPLACPLACPLVALRGAEGLSPPATTARA